ncbi:UDP-N-acetylmuramoyl-L-alanyl-D-glutamate--2,6-diaminopimelate ligase [Alteromonas aestuariivivens]|uniref:UDP-N-acetylmuramyl-tripeptide synthetase n=1 Tax=Alteromonas aestuariivivens TaxID=1938339 RepID=A0A3D8ME84_9ALTE|nr:UDP-N-acetylmuramoyl-L-alanyl-D-glutamate--2,6-diaminopimelate ligase [Alteromonas aestuariivivens]RDV29063.1 UDP-N-acetylmuramoyl-L-alanyl-D-glutamate--2,6-diaminopimelate ligase [Alteromonas aestuariivivens]
MVVSAFIQSTRAWLAKFGLDVPDIRIEGLTLDSREVNTRVAFLAVKGHERDGREFIPQAISLGARVVVAQTDDRSQHGALEMRGNTVIIAFYELQYVLSSLAAAFYDYPANKMSTIAVTGTNGKTSVVQLVTQLKALLGTRSAAIGTLGSGVYEGPQTEWVQSPAANTTPDAINFQCLLAEFVQQQVQQVAFEASSHALVQGRLHQVNTDIAVFTNLSRDHLDYHQTMEEYAKAKRGLLRQPGLRTVVVNGDDLESQNWLAEAPETMNKVWVSCQGAPATLPECRHCLATKVAYHEGGCEFYLQSSWGASVVKIPLLGAFNVSNVLLAVAALLAQGERFDDLVRVLPAIQPVPGRMEVFEFTSNANIVVDYAHTPDALEKALHAARLHTGAEVWCVFGCGGDRDKGKRPLMGKAAELGADHVIVTTDNSRSEAPDAIAADILAGMKEPQLAFCEPDRESAIRYCLDKAAGHDLIVVAGKGHEDYQIIGNTKTDYNERALVARLQQEYSI